MTTSGLELLVVKLFGKKLLLVKFEQRVVDFVKRMGNKRTVIVKK